MTRRFAAGILIGLALCGGCSDSGGSPKASTSTSSTSTTVDAERAWLGSVEPALSRLGAIFRSLEATAAQEFSTPQAKIDAVKSIAGSVADALGSLQRTIAQAGPPPANLSTAVALVVSEAAVLAPIARSVSQCAAAQECLDRINAQNAANERFNAALASLRSLTG